MNNPLRHRRIAGNNGQADFHRSSTSTRENSRTGRKSKRKLQVSTLCSKRSLLFLFLVLILTVSLKLTPALYNMHGSTRQKKKKPGSPSYIVCNGLSNQFLTHAAHISNAIQSEEDIFIPDVFIFNGVQLNTFIDTLPSEENSLPLHMIIDTDALLEYIRSKGIKGQIVPYSEAIAFDDDDDDLPICNWQQALARADHQIAQDILNILNPSTELSNLIKENLSNLLVQTSKSTEAKLSDGICVHHRDGQDWHNHCKIWEGPHYDKVWRKNCLNDRNLPLPDLIKYRIPDKLPKSWIYYIGDMEPSDQMRESFKAEGLDLFHRTKNNLLGDQEIARAFEFTKISLDTHRDLFTAVDFFTCSEIDSFIGNSVSTFSSNQIAKRNSVNSSWYNSRSIPLSMIFKVFYVPIVYTYTEESQSMSKVLLKASILSVRGTFGAKSHIHIIYHGEDDIEFLDWLETNAVIIHKHHPTWLETIETMRQHGKPKRSHLFLDKGNYIGTWQRIDIPLFIDAEYCLMLDSDTVIHSKFGMNDFGLDITPGLAVSSEGDEVRELPLNLGVALFNVPMLRETHTDFMKFIESHTENPEFKDLNISDQGAYLEFYESTTRFLNFVFNVKPYWSKDKHFKRAKITHFHGLKPHDILKLMMGFPIESFPKALRFLIPKVMPGWFSGRIKERHVCQTMYDFSLHLAEDLASLEEYCNMVFDTDKENESNCVKFFEDLAAVPEGDYSRCFQLIPRKSFFKRIFGR